MILYPSLIVLIACFSSRSLVLALSNQDIHDDTSISSLLNSADKHLRTGEINSALEYYDVAISRDPQNYITYFKRGTAYLSLGKINQASADFSKSLTIKPGFEGALLQMAKIKARSGDWDGSEADFKAHKNSVTDLAELLEAKKAAHSAEQAENSKNWDECVRNADTAILVASKMARLRQTRAHCRFEKGEFETGMVDLQHLLQLQPGMTDPHIKISALNFYGFSDTKRGIDQLRKCLHSDPESKPCKTLYRQEKKLDVKIEQVKKNLKMKQFITAVKVLLPTGDDVGLVQEVKDEVADLVKSGGLTKNSPNGLVDLVVQMTCEAYYKESTIQQKIAKALPWCDEAIKSQEHFLYGMLAQAQDLVNKEAFEAAINSLQDILEHHPDSEEAKQKMQETQLQLRRQKAKDYYKVLEVSRDADAAQIKAAYRRMVRAHHPDKAHKRGIKKEDAEKKMAAINEAYEVLSNRELKARFDQGDDPNDHSQQHSQNPFQQQDWFQYGARQHGQHSNDFQFEFNGQQFQFF
ncbi:BgTH12-02790 [Blumeria graminis f. sp. triticale]|uniref:Tetratricopeptide repeat and J domain-containing co-chaperone DNJ1 n=1 Tax=Blumeria graminis f. sp. triticale TaxID=1689686 RepID=A0A9W4GFR9_BLUGR|nr:BgTH12-02790 [Blumeria graminis f. sp. triticale]